MSEFDDDDLLLQAMEKFENSERQESCILSTPPDAQVLKNLRGNIMVYHPKKEDCGSKESNNCSKIMGSLLNNNTFCTQESYSPINSLSTDIYNDKRKCLDNLAESCKFNINSSKIHKTLSTFKNCSIPSQISVNNLEKTSKFIPNCGDNFILKPTSEKILSHYESPVSSTSRKRKFPGPAGLLPQWNLQNNLDLNKDKQKIEATNLKKSAGSLCHPMATQEFLSRPWKQMLLDLIQTESSSKELLHENNIQWILRRGNLRGSASLRKISFLAIMVRSIDLSHLDAPALFQDETGEINGTISKGILEQFSDYIMNGSVLVLRDVPILSPSSFQSGMTMIKQLKRHYLNITFNSLISIYAMDDEERVRKIEVIKLTKELVKSLSGPESNRGRKEVVENEEIGDVDVVPMFSHFLEKREVKRQVLSNESTPTRNQFAHDSFKSPSIISNNQGLCHVPRANFSQVCHSPAPQSAKNKSLFQEFKQPTFPKPKEHAEIKERAHLSSTHCENESPKRSPFTKIPTASSNPRQTLSNSLMDAFANDDQEFDSLLASIDTDAL